MKPSQAAINAFFDAAAKGQLDGLRAFARKYPQSINIQGPCGRSALMHAVCCEQPQAAALLLDLGATQDVRDNLGYAPCDAALRIGRQDLIVLMLRDLEIKARNDEYAHAMCMLEMRGSAELYAAVQQGLQTAGATAMNKLQVARRVSPFDRGPR